MLCSAQNTYTKPTSGKIRLHIENWHLIDTFVHIARSSLSSTLKLNFYISGATKKMLHCAQSMEVYQSKSSRPNFSFWSALKPARRIFTYMYIVYVYASNINWTWWNLCLHNIFSWQMYTRTHSHVTEAREMRNILYIFMIHKQTFLIKFILLLVHKKGRYVRFSEIKEKKENEAHTNEMHLNELLREIRFPP